MGAEIDRLEIEVEAQATKANNALDKLVGNLERLAGSLGSIKSDGLAEFASGVDELGTAAKSIAGVKVSNFSTIANGIKKLSQLDASQMISTADGIKHLAQELGGISGLDFDASGIVSVANSMSKLGGVKATAGTQNLQTVKDDLAKFVTGMNSIGSVNFDVDSLIGLINSISRLGSKSATQAAQNLPPISAQLQNLVRQMNNIESLKFDMTGVENLVSSISKLGSKSAVTAAANIPNLTKALSEMMTVLSKAPTVSSNLINMTTALAGLANQGSKVGSTTRSMTSSLNGYSASAQRASKSSKGLASVFGSLYANFFWVKRGADKLWKSIETSMDYVETLNYFDAAFGQVAESAVSQWEDAGAESAEAYYKSFSDRAKQLTSKMTGFSVKDDGTLQATEQPSLGIDPEKLMNYQATFGQMASSMVVTAETSLKLSQALTEIGGDLASVKNLDFDKVWNDMASGLAGMSRTLDKYGVNIRNVNLQQKLYELGIQANITALNQNDKALLRAIILLDSTKYAWGDLATTINQPANQLRLIESNFQNLSRTIGNLFLPAVSNVLPYVNAMVIALQRLATWIGNLLGIDLSKVTKSVGESSFDFGSIADEAEAATEAVNKLQKGIRKFDELDVITTSSGSSSGSSGGLDSDLLDKAFNDAFNEYQNAWDEAFANMENKAQDLADKIEEFFAPVKKIFQDLFDGDFFAAGQDSSKLVAGIFNWFADAIAAVDWYKIGHNIGEFLAGIDWIDIFKAVGRVMWEGLKGAFELVSGLFDAAPLEATILTFVSLSKVLKAITGTKFYAGIVKIVKGFKDFYETAKVLGKGNVFKGLSGALDNVRDNMSLLNKATITAVAGFAEFKVVYNTTEDLVKGTENLLIGLTKIGGTVALAGAAMYVTLGPAGIAAAAITGITAGLMGIDNAFIEIRESARESEEIDKYGDTLENISIKAQEASQSLIEASEARRALVENVGDVDVSYINTLKDKYFELSQKIGLSADEQAELKLVSEKLVDYFPQLEEFYNSTTGLLDVQRETLEELITQKEKELKLSAISDQWEAALKDQIEAQKDLKENTTSLKTATDELSTAYAEMEAYQNSFADPSMANLQDYWDKIGKLTLAVETYTESTTNAKKALEEINGEIEDYSAMYSEWSNDFENLGTDGSTGYAEGFEESASKAIEAANKMISSVLDEMATEQDSHSPSKKTKELGKDAVDGYNLGITDNADSTLEIIDGFIDKALEKFSTITSSVESIGVNTIKGLIDGMSSIENDLYRKAEDIADNVTKTMQTALDIHSPSKVMFELGGYTMEGFKDGMENLYDPIEASLKALGGRVTIAPLAGVDRTYNTTEFMNQYSSRMNPVQISTQSNSEADTLLRQQNNLLQRQNELLLQILQKPTIDNDDVFQAARSGYRVEATRLGAKGNPQLVWG